MPSRHQLFETILEGRTLPPLPEHKVLFCYHLSAWCEINYRTKESCIDLYTFREKLKTIPKKLKTIENNANLFIDT